MVSFTEVVGGDAGPLLDYYFVYIFVFLLFGIVSYVGLFRLLYKVAQQMLIMTFMCCLGALWWILVTNHLSFLREAASSNMAATKATQFFTSGMNGGGSSDGSGQTILNDVLNEPELVGPISEIILITGTTIMILSWLYRQLPIDLIPDCIPCIGKYDNMVAGLCLFSGLVVTLVGIYVQWHYVKQQNSTKLVYQYFSHFTEDFRSFLKQPTETQIDKLNGISKDIFLSLIKFSAMVKQSFVMIFQRLQGTFTDKQEL